MEPLTVPAQLDSLNLIGHYVVTAANAAGLDKKSAYRLRLAVDEIATNIINHGYLESGLGGDVRVEADLKEDTLTVLLEDSAVHYDPRERGRPESIDLPVDEKPIGGLGVFLAIEGVDEFRYEYVDQHNRNIFVMRRPTS